MAPQDHPCCLPAAGRSPGHGSQLELALVKTAAWMGRGSICGGGTITLPCRLVFVYLSEPGHALAVPPATHTPQRQQSPLPLATKAQPP